MQKKTLLNNLKTNKKAIVASTHTDAKRSRVRVEPPVKNRISRINATLVLVPENLALLGYDAPEKREQHFPAFRRIVAPKFAAQLFRSFPDAAVLLIQQIGVGAGEYFLPTQTIAHDQNHVSSFELGLRECGGEDERYKHAR